MELDKIVLINIGWRFAERIGAQGVRLIVEIILARLLLPEDYGIVALASVLITVFNVFIDSGLGSALIQKKDCDAIDFSTVFWFNIAGCALLYLILFFLSPLISKWFHNPDLCMVIRVLSIQILISGIKNVEQAYVSRHFEFRKFFFATLIGTIGAAAAGCWLAFMGMGVWALVAQQLVNTVLDTVILWMMIDWRPKPVFSFERLRHLFSYGWKLMVSALIDTVYTEIRQFIIGRTYSAADLAYYNRGRQFPFLFAVNVNASIDSVLFPAMSIRQDQPEYIREMTRRTIKVSTYVICPVLAWLIFAAEPFICLLLSRKWLPSVPYLRIFCVSCMFYPIHTANLNAIKALGRSDLFLKLEIIKKAVGVAALIATMGISVRAMAYSLLFSNTVSQIINSWPNRKLLHYTYLEQIKDILPNLLLSLAMGISIWWLPYLGLPDILTVCLQLILAAAIYLGGSALLKMDAYVFLMHIFRQKDRKKEG